MSRKITQLAVAAFLAGESFSRDNTRVTIDETGVCTLLLHGNAIARRDITAPAFVITVAGWPTVTTKERLNGLPGVRVCSHKRQLHLNGQPWNGEWTRIALDGAVKPLSPLAAAAEETRTLNEAVA